MATEGIQGYLIPRADEFQGEFVAPYAERLKYISGFTGSAGIALILNDKAFLLTDGRYLTQAASQTNYAIGDYIEKPTGSWIKENAGQGDIMAYDPMLFTIAQIEKIEAALEDTAISLKPISENLIDAIWLDQPAKPKGQVFPFPDSIAGIPFVEKRNLVANSIKAMGAKSALITMPDSVSWLLNMRGEDIDYIPYILSYAAITDQGKVTWFIDPDKIPDALNYDKDIEIIDINAISDALKTLPQPIAIDKTKTPIAFKENANSNFVEIKDPCSHPRSLKSPQEQDSIRRAHIKDGVALVKFLKWLEEEGQSSTEMDVAEALRNIRAEDPAFKGNSFPTISGFAGNGAIIHYRATEGTNAALENGNLLLIDSGGQYAGECFGTTDITRTIAIGQPTQEMRRMNTLVLMGHIDLANAKFPKGTTGIDIDKHARKPLQDEGFNFAHGTGHGVGCYLCVHEDAANISPRGKEPLEAGMLLSNEPGYYKEGDGQDGFGIRIENLVLVQQAGEETLNFETISLAPIDQSLIIPDMLSGAQIDWLNNYHEKVYVTLSPLLDDDHRAWLQRATAPLTAAPPVEA